MTKFITLDNLKRFKTNCDDEYVLKESFSEIDPGIPTLIGTEEAPINLYTMTEVGKLYVIQGYINSSSGLSIWNFDLPVLFMRYMKEAGTIYGASITIRDGVPLITYGQHLISYAGISANIGDITSVSSYKLPRAINGLNYGRVVDIYAPETAGTAGQILQSNGSGAPTWVDPATAGIATITDIEAAIGNVSALLGDTSDLEV